MLRILLASTTLACLASNATALEIAGWQIDTAPNASNECTISRHYVDKDDHDAHNAVALVFGKENGKLAVAIALGYGEWDWESDDTRTADLLVDDEVEQRALTWNAKSSKHGLAYSTPDWQTLTQSLAAGQTITLRFDGDKSDEASFAAPNLGQALGAAQVCNSQIK